MTELQPLDQLRTGDVAKQNLVARPSCGHDAIDVAVDREIGPVMFSSMSATIRPTPPNPKIMVRPLASSDIRHFDRSRLAIARQPFVSEFARTGVAVKPTAVTAGQNFAVSCADNAGGCRRRDRISLVSDGVAMSKSCLDRNSHPNA